MGRPMQLAKYVKFREEKFGGVLFETRSEKVYALNPTAAAVVREIQSGTPEDEIPARLQASFDADQADRIEREAVAFAHQLRDNGLVVES